MFLRVTILLIILPNYPNPIIIREFTYADKNGRAQRQYLDSIHTYDGWKEKLDTDFSNEFTKNFKITHRPRVKKRFRKAQNAADSEASQRFTDSLLNYETVKYFDATSHEERRYDEAVPTLGLEPTTSSIRPLIVFTL